MEMWLQKFFASAPILKNIYMTFFAFKKTVFDCMKEKISEQLEGEESELSKYHIVDNYYDLQALMAELAEMFP